jgi:hypothetical protein
MALAWMWGAREKVDAKTVNAVSSWGIASRRAMH